jgi:glucuronoarabinoxylan endo-1,4-beta-xylanase
MWGRSVNFAAHLKGCFTNTKNDKMMGKIWKSLAMGTMMLVGMSSLAMAQTKATVRLEAQKTHQRITGFGGFVCSPQFTYNHMSNAEIEKVWGAKSTVGCNIMRLYIPVGRNSWSQSLQTAKTAKQLGLIVFASPWGQPAEWKTNNSINAKNEGENAGSLKKENHFVGVGKMVLDNL